MNKQKAIYEAPEIYAEVLLKKDILLETSDYVSDYNNPFSDDVDW